MLQKAHYLVFQIFPISRAPAIGKLDSSHSSFQLQPKKGNTTGNTVADLSNHLCTVSLWRASRASRRQNRGFYCRRVDRDDLACHNKKRLSLFSPNLLWTSHFPTLHLSHVVSLLHPPSNLSSNPNASRYFSQTTLLYIQI